MGYLLAGMVFILMNVTIRLGWLRIVLLPDVIGYVLLSVKMPGKLRQESGKFETVRRISPLLALLSVGVGIQRALAKTGPMMVLAYVLNMVMLAAGLAVSCCVNAGFAEIQQKFRRNLQVHRLKVTWMAMTAVVLIGGLCGWIPVLGPVCRLASGIATICYLVLLYSTENLHERLV